MIVLSACCSYILIVAKGKNWSNQRKNLPYQKNLTSGKIWNKIKTSYKPLNNGTSI